MSYHQRAWRLRGAFRTYLVTREANVPAEWGRPVSPRVVSWFLDDWLRSDEWKLQQIYEALEGGTIYFPATSIQALRSRIRERLQDAFLVGSLKAYEMAEPQLPAFPRRQEIPAAPEPEPDPTWFEIRVVWDDTGEPIPDLPLVIQSKNGSTTMRQTDSKGQIRLENVQGCCEVRSNADGVPLTKCSSFAGTDDPVIDKEKRKGPPARRPNPVAVANIQSHSVQDGETLDSIARQHGLTWQKLAKFNWETDDPKRINQHLVADVGCRRRTRDGKNYLFSSNDDPGIIFVPKAWKLPGLATAVHHVLRVRYVEYPKVAFLWSA